MFDRLTSLFRGKGQETGKAQEQKLASTSRTAVHNKRRVDIHKRFELLREAVSGTMSNFYMARDRERNELVGLKVGVREKVEMFESRFKGLKKPPEGELASRLHHPLIVETYEYGLTTVGLPYIVMEFVPGQGMHQLIYTRDKILEGKRANLVKQMAEALNVVHKTELIHRDVCPRNFICLPGAEALKLIDFGLTLPAKKEYMQPGNRTGTPLYMAPEVVRRRATDQRLDIFSFGVTAYHLCTFELPWPSSETSGLAAMNHDTDPTSIFFHRATLNKALGKAIHRCLAARPDDRPSTMDAVLQEIRGISSDDEP